MSDSVNDYGLGASGTQSSAPVPHPPRINPLSTGLGAPDGVEPQLPDEDPTERGLGSQNTQPGEPVEEEPQPPQHGLGS